MGGLKCLWLSCNLSFISRVWFIFNEAFKSLCRRWVVWFDPWLAPLQDCFLLKHWRVGGAYGETLGTDCLTVWDSQTDEECHVWAEFTKCLRGRRGERRGKKKKIQKLKKPSAISSLVSASSHSIIRDAPSNSLHSFQPKSTSWRRTIVVGIQARSDDQSTKQFIFSLFNQKNWGESGQSQHKWPGAI